jgi:hypothetical protein
MSAASTIAGRTNLRRLFVGIIVIAIVRHRHIVVHPITRRSTGWTNGLRPAALGIPRPQPHQRACVQSESSGVSHDHLLDQNGFLQN